MTGQLLALEPSSVLNELLSSCKAIESSQSDLPVYFCMRQLVIEFLFHSLGTAQELILIYNIH